MRRCVVFSMMFLFVPGPGNSWCSQALPLPRVQIKDLNLAERGVAYRSERNSQRRRLTAP
jgi:hypothetical protein